MKCLENYTLAEKITMFHHMKKNMSHNQAQVLQIPFIERKVYINGILIPQFRVS